jgi:outer membrane protein assembly factor BamB
MLLATGRRAVPFAVAILAPLASAGAVNAREAGWPMAGRDPAHSAFAEGPSPPYEIVWRSKIAGGGPVSSPVLLVPDGRGSGSAVEGALIVLGEESVTSLDPETGGVRWSRGRLAGGIGGVAISESLILHPSGGLLVGRDVEDGSAIWNAPLGADASTPPTVASGTAFVGTREGDLVAVDVATGRVQWTFEGEGRIDAPPAVGDGLAVIVTFRPAQASTAIRALDEGTGEEEWEVGPEGAGSPSGPSIADGRVHVGTGDLRFRTLELASGEEIWSTDGRDRFGLRQMPASGEALLFADRTHLYRLDPETGEELWTFRLADLTARDGRAETVVASSPVQTRDVAVIGNSSGVLSAIDLASGRRVWRMDLGGAPVSAAAIAEDRIYVATLGERGEVIALEHDPSGTLVEETSPTVLFVDRALLSFAAAAAVVGAAILLLFRLALRRREAT